VGVCGGVSFFGVFRGFFFVFGGVFCGWGFWGGVIAMAGFSFAFEHMCPHPLLSLSLMSFSWSSPPPFSSIRKHIFELGLPKSSDLRLVLRRGQLSSDL